MHFDLGDGYLEFDGDAAAGAFTLDDGFGDRHAIVWNEAGLVGLEHFHEIPEDAAVGDAPPPWRYLRALPDALRPLATSAYERCEQRVNSGLWLCGDRYHRHSPHGLALTAYFTDDEDARAPWSEELSEAQTKLARRLAASPKYKLSAAESEVALEDPRGGDGVLDEDKVASAAAQLAKLGVTWPGLERATKRARAARLASRAKLQTPADKALLDAIIAGDFMAACAAFDAGARVNCATLEGQYFAEPDGATPLLLALRHKHDDLAELLIESGADLDRPTSHGERPLVLAATRGNAAMCAAPRLTGPRFPMATSGFGLVLFTVR